MRIALVTLATLSFGVTLMAADPFAGTWVLNVEKSKIVGGNVASETVKITENGPTGYMTITDSVSKSGEKQHREINRMIDGKQHPSTGKGFVQAGATDITQQVNEKVRKMTHNVNGKMGAEITSTISPDGKTMTNRRIGPGGEAVLVYEKQ